MIINFTLRGDIEQNLEGILKFFPMYLELYLKHFILYFMLYIYPVTKLLLFLPKRNSIMPKGDEKAVP